MILICRVECMVTMISTSNIVSTLVTLMGEESGIISCYFFASHTVDEIRVMSVWRCFLGVLLASYVGDVTAFQHPVAPNRSASVTGPPDRTLLQASTITKENKSSRWGWIFRNRRRRDEESGNSIDFDSILQSRRTINDFHPQLPDNWEDMLQKAIKSAMFAPNHKRTEPWRFHLLGKEAIRKVCQLNASIVSEKKGEKAGEKKLERWLQMPGWLVVTCRTSGDVGESMDKPDGLRREDYAACCCAVQNLCLSLHNSGMGTKWTTGPVNFDPRFKEIVDLDKNEYVVGTIWFGTPEKIPEPPGKKQAVEDVLIKHN